MNFEELERGIQVLENTLKKQTYDRPNTPEGLLDARVYLREGRMWTRQYMEIFNDGVEVQYNPIVDVLTKDNDSTQDMINYLEKQIQIFVEFVTDEEEMRRCAEVYSPQGNVHTSMCLFNIYSKITEAIMWLKISQ